MIKKKKIFITLGALITTIIPISTVMACGTTALPTDDEIETKNKLNLSAGIIEQNYQELLLKKLNDDPATGSTFDPKDYTSIFNSFINKNLNNNVSIAIKDLAKFFIKENVFSNHNYLKGFGNELLNHTQDILSGIGSFVPLQSIDGTFKKIDYSILDYFHLLREVPANGLPWIAEINQNTKFEDFIKLLLKTNILNFKNEFYKFLISFIYLDTNKSDWDSVYHKNGFRKDGDKFFAEYTATDSEINEEQFLLTREVLKTKPFFTWEASLNEDKSKAFINYGKISLNDADNLLIKSNNSMPIGFSLENKKLPTHLQKISHNIYPLNITTYPTDNLMAYKGIEKRTEVGTKSLSFKLDELKKITDETKYFEAYNGYVINNELKTSNIELFEKDAKTVKVTRVAGIMPMYELGKFTVNKFDRTSLKEIIYFQDGKDIYDNALIFYTNKTDPIKLKIDNNYLREAAIDKFGFNFIEEN